MRPYTLICRLVAGDIPIDLTNSDWRQIVSLADAHGVASLVYHKLRERGRLSDVPEQVHATLQQHYYRTTSQNTLLLHEFKRIVDALDSAHVTVPIIVLKGMALATTLYADPALRPLHDGDLLIPRTRLDEIVDVMRSIGYHRPIPKLAVGIDQTRDWHIHLRGGAQDNLAFELHWNLVGGDMDRYAPSLDWFWKQTEAWELLNGDAEGRRRMRAREQAGRPTVLQLTPTAHLLYCAAHLMLQHGEAEGRLIWFYDLHLLLTKVGERIEWDEMIARAEEFHWAPALHAALNRTHDLFASPVPPNQTKRLATVAAQDEEATQLVARRTRHHKTRTQRLRNTMSGMSWRGRLQVVLGYLLPRPEYIRWRYEPKPAWVWPLYYPYRWLDILQDGMQTIARMVQRRRGS